MNEVWQIAMTITVACLVVDNLIEVLRDYRALRKAQRGKHFDGGADCSEEERDGLEGQI